MRGVIGVSLSSMIWRICCAISRIMRDVPCDLPLKFHPVAIRASAVDTPFGAD
jgi:hypothetical protein